MNARSNVAVIVVFVAKYIFSLFDSFRFIEGRAWAFQVQLLFMNVFGIIGMVQTFNSTNIRKRIISSMNIITHCCCYWQQSWWERKEKRKTREWPEESVMTVLCYSVLHVVFTNTKKYSSCAIRIDRRGKILLKSMTENGKVRCRDLQTCDRSFPADFLVSQMDRVACAMCTTMTILMRKPFFVLLGGNIRTPWYTLSRRILQGEF